MHKIDNKIWIGSLAPVSSSGNDIGSRRDCHFQFGSNNRIVFTFLSALPLSWAMNCTPGARQGRGGPLPPHELQPDRSCCCAALTKHFLTEKHFNCDFYRWGAIGVAAFSSGRCAMLLAPNPLGGVAVWVKDLLQIHAGPSKVCLREI